MNQPDKRNIYLYSSIIVVLIFLTYSNALQNGFVYDDNFQILGNKWLKSFKYIPEIFTSKVWAFKNDHASNYYRPMMHLLYMLEYYIFGLKAWGFHLTNILLHACVSILVFLTSIKLISELKPDIPVNKAGFFSFIGASLFATHPIHTEAVTWVASLPELSFTFFTFFRSFFISAATERITWFGSRFSRSYWPHFQKRPP